MSNSSKAIKFNVGGTKYEVSQSLLDRYPDCMLTRMCSETWQQGGDEKDDGDGKAIFIDRNGERFQYVLDYMRDLRVELPISIPRGQFICDLEYYALNYDNDAIVLSVVDPSDLFHSLGRYRDYFQSKSQDIETRLRSVAAEKLACDVAKEYFSQLLQEKPQDQSSRSSTGRVAIESHQVQKGINFFCAAPIKVSVPPGFSGSYFKVEDIQRHLETVGLKTVGRVLIGKENPYNTIGLKESELLVNVSLA